MRRCIEQEYLRRVPLPQDSDRSLRSLPRQAEPRVARADPVSGMGIRLSDGVLRNAGTMLLLPLLGIHACPWRLGLWQGRIRS